MKSIKLASGFAVSALALAIAGQATAQSQTDVSFSGDIKVQTVIDLQRSQYTNQQPGLVTANEDWYNFLATWNVTHGPFSGRLRIGINEKEIAGTAARAGGSNSDAQVIVDNLVVTEGPVMFGQLGRVTATAGLYESLTNTNEASQASVAARTSISKEDTSTRFGVDLGLRYTVAEAGLRLQLESPIANDENVFGVAGAIHQNLDVAQVWLDGQYHVTTKLDGTSGMANHGKYNVGAAAQANLADPVTVTGVFRTVTDDAVGSNPRNVLAAQIRVAATDEVSLRGLITDRNFSSKAGTTVARVGGTVSLAPFTIMADYEALTSDMSDAFYDARVTWADGPLTAFTRVRYAQKGFDGAGTNAGRLTTGASFTTDSGIVYGAEHNLTQKDYKKDGNRPGNELELFASYSF